VYIKHYINSSVYLDYLLTYIFVLCEVVLYCFSVFLLMVLHTLNHRSV